MVGGCLQGCQFSDFRLISDFLTIQETGIKLNKYGQNMGKISIVPKDMHYSGKGFEHPSLNAVSEH